MAKEIKCIYCSAVHTDHINGDSYKCEYCGGLNFVTSTDEDFKFQLAHTYLSSYQFVKADDLYKQIIEECTNDKAKSMALMGRILSYFGIVYVKSYGSNVTTPTFSRYNPEIQSIKSSRYYKALCNLEIDSYELDEYKKQIEDLDKVYTRIDSDLNATPEYDVFICTKISMKTKNDPDNKGYTEDSKVALDLYYTLKEKGLKVFYSDKVLQGVDYDSQIYSALSKSKTILVLASCKEYLESVWVESEWRRWLNFIDVEYREKNTFLLHLIKSGIEVPSALQKAQVIDYYNIFDAIDNIVNQGKKKINLEQALLDKIKKLEEENKLHAEELKKIQETGIKTTTTHVHQYESKVIPATCTESGYTLHSCKECGEVFKDNITKPLGHKFEMLIKNVTCISDGKKENKCIHCGYSNGIITIPKTGIHEYVLKKKVEPTCFDDGYTLNECVYCHKVIKENIVPKLSHKWQKIIDPYGNLKLTCEICGSVTDDYDLFFEDLFDYAVNFDGTYSITGFNNEKFNEFIRKEKSVVIYIPSIHNGKKVTQIADYAFANNKFINRLVFSNNIEIIGENAFSDCENLDTIYMGYNVKIIKNLAFNNCYALNHLILSESLEKIENTAFGCCESLRILDIPKSVQKIEKFAFAGCTNLSDVTLYKHISYIEDDAFAYCYNAVVSIYSYDNVKKLPKTWSTNALDDVSKIKYITE